MEKNSEPSQTEAPKEQDLRPGLMLMLGERVYLIAKLQAENADILKRLDELNRGVEKVSSDES